MNVRDHNAKFQSVVSLSVANFLFVCAVNLLEFIMLPLKSKSLRPLRNMYVVLRDLDV